MDITVKELTAYLGQNYQGRVNEQGLFMKLVEEVGETAEVLNIRAGRKADDGGNTAQSLAEELADIIHYAAAIAAVNDIDLGDVILQKDKRASVKYGRTINLETFAEELRAKQ